MNEMLLKKPSFKKSSTAQKIVLQIAVLLIAVCCSSQVFAQKKTAAVPSLKRCGTMEALQQEMQTNPELRARILQGEIDYQNSLKPNVKGSSSQMNRPATPASLPGPITIPVVVHIVLPNPWLITDEAVEYFINRLNTDFSGLNADSSNAGAFLALRGHSLLRFVLAKRDPAGNFTTGIIRKIGTTQIAQTTNQPIKNSATATGGSTGWNVSQYYNLYVGDGGAAGLLGISPGIGPGGAAGSNNADGVCVDYRSFGPNCFSYPEYNMSRTAVHEIGHNFGLYHPFDNGCTSDDFRQLTSAGCSLPPNLLAPADDIPHQADPTQGCPSGSITNGCSPIAARMYQNYMDYTDDACYSMFTKGEAARMEWVLENCRAGYLTTLGGQYPASIQPLDAAVNSVVSPGGQDFSNTTCKGVIYPPQSCPGSFVPRLRISNAGTTTLTSITVTTTINGLNPQTKTFTVNIPYGKSQIVVLDPQIAIAGINALKFSLSAPNGSTDGNAANNDLTTTFNTGVPLVIPYTENFTAAAFPPANGSAVINPDADVTWARTTAAGRPGPASIWLDLFNYNAVGERDIYRTPTINTAPFDSLKVSFYVAYQQYPGTSDSLRVVYSADCGATWFPTSYAKGGAGLSTVTGTLTTAFTPTTAQWRKETVVLTDFCLKNIKNLQIGFQSYNDFGNNLYVDSITVSGVTGKIRNAKLEAIPKPLSAFCARDFTPEITFSNGGTDTLRSLQIKYVVDNGTDTATYNWTGSLGKCDFTTAALATVNAAFGSHTIKIFTLLPNGAADQVPANDTLVKPFTIFTTATLPVFEGFESTAFPGSGWGVVNVNGGTTWQKSISSAKTGAASMWINNPNASNSNGAVDYYISPIIVNSASNDSVFVDFDMSYRSGPQYPGSTVFPLDTLEILSTADCGATFTSVWKKWGNELQTVNDPNYTSTSSFVPSIKDQWKSKRIYLTPVVGADNFQLYFASKSNKQNNIWIDNINISSKTLPQRLKDQGYLIYPNPFNSSFLIHHSAVEPPVDLQSVQVFNSAGQMLWEKEYNGNAARQITVDLKTSASGVYILKMIYTNKTVIERIVKN